MDFIQTSIAGAVEIRLVIRKDERGRFKRQFCETEFANSGLGARWVQMNHSVTRGLGLVRGLHFQFPPAAEAKLVSCVMGRAFDVAVDLRRDSATYLGWTAVEIDESTSFYIPPGCAHGFQALEDEVHLTYLHSAPYSPDFESGVRFDDPAIGVDWPLPISATSDRDRSFAYLTPSFKGVTL